MPTRSFRILRWLQRPHGTLTRHGLATLAWALVLCVTAQRGLAQEAARLWRDDTFKIGAHRISWYLHHGWTARVLHRPVPLFDPTTGMDIATLSVLDRWLARRTTPRHRLAQLHVKARQIVIAQDAATQKTCMSDFARIANELVKTWPQPDPHAPAAPAGPAPVFTLTEARAALAALRAVNLPWYLISGTFLGAVREGTFLAHDYDIDIGIHAEDFDDHTLRAEVMAAADLTLVNTSPALDLSYGSDGLWSGVSLPALYRVLHASGIGIDVFVHHLDGDIRWHGSAKHRWNNHDFALENYTIADLPAKGPADADRYLTENYGDWRTPVTQFNCSTGTPNVVFPRNPLALTELLHIALRPHMSRDTQVARLILWQEGYLQSSKRGVTFFVFPWQEHAA